MEIILQYYSFLLQKVTPKGPMALVYTKGCTRGLKAACL